MQVRLQRPTMLSEIGNVGAASANPLCDLILSVTGSVGIVSANLTMVFESCSVGVPLFLNCPTLDLSLAIVFLQCVGG